MNVDSMNEFLSLGDKSGRKEYHISCNTGKSALLDMYARCLRAHSAQEQVQTYQAMHK